MSRKLRNNLAFKKNDTQYWASLPPEEFINECHARIREFYDDLQMTGLDVVIAKAYRYYYGGDETGALFESARLSRGGKQGQLTLQKTNHYRNVLKHILQLATANRPAFKSRSRNTDYQSQAQTILADGILDYYLREEDLNELLVMAGEYALSTTEGWIHCPWDASLGEKIVDGRSKGDMRFTAHSILDVPRPIRVKTGKFPWLCVREFVNKWDLIAQFPHLKDQILENASTFEDYEDFESFTLNIRENDLIDSDDLCVKWTFYHKKTPALPQGRMAEFVGQLPLNDGQLAYKRIPLHRVRPDSLLDSPYSYSPGIDLLGSQQAFDILNSILMTNNATLGVNNIWTKPNDNIAVTTLKNGMNHLQSQTKPETVQLTASAPEAYNLRGLQIKDLETLSGISSTVRGQPEASLKSGNALALVVSQSVQFASAFEMSCNALFEDVGTSIIEHLQKFAVMPRTAVLVGKFNQPMIREFTGADLSSVDRVIVDQQSALAKTVAGKVELANNLMQQGLIKDPNQYITVLTTGNLDPAMEGAQSQMLNIRAENEALQRGEQVEVIVSENHAKHIEQHNTLLENPEAKKNPALVQVTLDHIQKHLDAWRNADPAILMITGQQPPPPPPGMMPGAMPGQPMPPQEPGMQAEGTAPSDAGMTPPELGAPSLPNLPPDTPPQAQAAYDQFQQNLPQ